MVNVPPSTTPDATYTSHAATAAVMSAAILEIATWGASLDHITVPASVGVAAAALITPFLSVALKKMGVLSS